MLGYNCKISREKVEPLLLEMHSASREGHGSGQGGPVGSTGD